MSKDNANMRSYELTVALDSQVSAAKKKAITEKLEKLVTTFKGKLGKMSDWGEINSGTFLHFTLELGAKGAKDLSNKLRLEGDIKRYLLVRSEK